jgi:1,4-dihydroxy-2-naphthoyl-CoA synthase
MSSPAFALKLENVLYEKKGPIAYVTINRPKVKWRSSESLIHSGVNS